MTNAQLSFIGSFLKTIGISGELLVKLEPAFSNLIQKAEHIFVEIDGLYVPFFISENSLSIRNTSNDYSATFALDGVTSDTKAKEFIGCNIFIEKTAKRTHISNAEIDLSELIGFTVVDLVHGEIGVLERINEYSSNILMQITTNSNEILIPLVPEIVKEINGKKRIITVQVPEGLLEINT